MKFVFCMVKFMMSEDWSVRMPEFREYITQFDIQRNTDFKKVFPDMAGLLDETLDNSIETKLGDKVDERTEKELADGGTI